MRITMARIIADQSDAYFFLHVPQDQRVPNAALVGSPVLGCKRKPLSTSNLTSCRACQPLEVPRRKRQPARLSCRSYRRIEVGIPMRWPIVRGWEPRLRVSIVVDGLL